MIFNWLVVDGECHLLGRALVGQHVPGIVGEPLRDFALGSSGATEIEPPTCMIMSGTAARNRAIKSLNFLSRLLPLPSGSRT